jgi:geranylgeranyl diphosphate synthase type II
VSQGNQLADFLSRARRAVDDALERYLPNAPACPPIVAEAMRYSVFAGGKRLRPVLTLAAADAIVRRSAEGLLHDTPAAPNAKSRVAQDFSPALPAACAIEMIHTYSLIHDDLPAMDSDTMRRGRPTLHVVYGDGIAILAGDGLQSAAFTLLAREPQDDEPGVIARKLRVAALVGAAAGPAGMVGGQAIDLQAAGQVPNQALRLDADGLRDMHARKTGALIRAAAAAGAIMAGADDGAVGAIDRYAEQVGLAFQIVDDILDVEGTDSALGKSAGKDAAARKPTYPALFGVERSRALAAECLEHARQALADARLTEGWLIDLAEWVVSRRS